MFQDQTKRDVQIVKPRFIYSIGSSKSSPETIKLLSYRGFKSSSHEAIFKLTKAQNEHLNPQTKPCTFIPHEKIRGGLIPSSPTINHYQGGYQ